MSNRPVGARVAAPPVDNSTAAGPVHNAAVKGWERALEAFVSDVGSALRWMLVGSAATCVQGVAVEPGDVDVLVHPQTSDEAMAAAVEAFERFSATGPVSQDPDLFLSTPNQPLVATPDGVWLFGRWMVDGFKLEVARIRIDLGPTAVIETMGTAVWDTQRTVSWRGHAVPVVPLEVQLATMTWRGLGERASAVRARLAEPGTDAALLAQAMADRGLG